MTVISVDKDLDNLTMTLVAEFDATTDGVWQLWADPRKLERWWGPPSYPSKFETLELEPGGRAAYHMTGPEGDRHHGLWRVVAVEPPGNLVFEDRFAGADGAPDDSLPGSRTTVTLTEQDGRTRMEIRSTFESREQMQQLLDMGMADGLTQSVGQMDALLS